MCVLAFFVFVLVPGCVYLCVYVCVAHQSQCLYQQKDLPCLEEMAWKDSNDLLPFTFVMELISLPLLFHLFRLVFSFQNCLFALFLTA